MLREREAVADDVLARASRGMTEREATNCLKKGTDIVLQAVRDDGVRARVFLTRLGGGSYQLDLYGTTVKASMDLYAVVRGATAALVRAQRMAAGWANGREVQTEFVVSPLQVGARGERR